jgi:AcrR family transcriptional regulator
VARDTRQRIIEAAERLFAQRGISQVSLREIIAAAGQRHKSAVRYYFGSKQRLLQEILDQRAPVMAPRRLALLASLEGDGPSEKLRSVAEAIVYPLAETVSSGSYFARFLAQLFADPVAPYDAPAEMRSRAETNRIERLLPTLLPDIPAATLALRYGAAWGLAMRELAVHERELEAGRQPAGSTATLATSLVDMIAAMLSAPVSAAGRRRGPGARHNSARAEAHPGKKPDLPAKGGLQTIRLVESELRKGGDDTANSSGYGLQRMGSKTTEKRRE